MTVEEIEYRYQQLRGQFNSGALSAEQFQAEVERLQFQDTQGRYWMIGSRSGRWYYHDGGRWVQAEPLRTTRTGFCPRCNRPVAPGAAFCAACGYQLASYPAPALRASPSPPVQRRRTQEVPSWVWVGCAALVIFGMMIAALLIGAGSRAFLGAASRPGLPTRPAIVPLPEVATQTPTALPPVVLLPTPTALLSSDPGTLIASGDELVLQSKFEEAITYYQRATEIDITNATAYARWARALYLHYWTRRDEALAKALVATGLDPSNPEALAQLARCYTWNDQSAKAVTAAQKAIALDASYAEAYSFLAEAHLAAGQTDEAQVEAQTAVQLNQGSAEAHRNMAYVLTEQKREEAALAELLKAAELEPNLAPRHYELGLLHQKMGRHNKAITAFERAVELYPDFAWAYSVLGKSYYDGPGDKEQALSTLEKALELDPQYAPTYYYIGYIHSESGECDQAIAMFEQALVLDPKLQEAEEGIAQCQLAMSRPTPAPTANETPSLEEGGEPTEEAEGATEETAPEEAPEAPSEEEGPPPAGEAAEESPAEEAPETPAEAGEEGSAEEAQLTGQIAYPVYYMDQAGYDVFITNADGSGKRFIMGRASQPDLSPDGQRIAYRSWKNDTRGMFFMDFSGLNFDRIAAQAFFEDGRPCFSFDGWSIVFFSRRESDRQPRLYIRDAGASGERGLGIIGTNPDWSPDGRIIYQGCSSEACGLIIINPNGDNPVIVTSDGRDAAPAVSPDGSKVAFMSQREGNWQLYTVNIDGSDLKRLTQSHTEDGLPAWSPDGQYVAYASGEAGRWSIWAIKADGSNPRQLFAISEGAIGGIVRGKPEWESRGWTEEHISWAP
jgi:TolB protein